MKKICKSAAVVLPCLLVCLAACGKDAETGTVTQDIKGAIAELKKGRVEFRADKAGIIHIGIGKVSMDKAKIKENIMALYEEVLKRRPADLKGEYVDTFYISATMSPAVKINTKSMAV